MIKIILWHLDGTLFDLRSGFKIHSELARSAGIVISSDTEEKLSGSDDQEIYQYFSECSSKFVSLYPSFEHYLHLSQLFVNSEDSYYTICLSQRASQNFLSYIHELHEVGVTHYGFSARYETEIDVALQKLQIQDKIKILHMQDSEATALSLQGMYDKALQSLSILEPTITLPDILLIAGNLSSIAKAEARGLSVMHWLQKESSPKSLKTKLFAHSEKEFKEVLVQEYGFFVYPKIVIEEPRKEVPTQKKITVTRDEESSDPIQKHFQPLFLNSSHLSLSDDREREIVVKKKSGAKKMVERELEMEESKVSVSFQ